MLHSRGSWLSKCVARWFAPVRPARRPIRLKLERFEDRTVPAMFTVNVTTDTGPANTGTGSGTSGDLRYCIVQANATPGPNTINYASGVAGTTVTSDLPIVANNLTLIGPAGLSLGGNTLAVNAGVTLTANAILVANGTLGGAGTIATDPANGDQFNAVTSQPSVTVACNSAADQFIHFRNNGPLYVAANINVTTPVTFFSGFDNQLGGSITVGANTHVNASNFQSYGTLTLAPGTSGTTQLTNINTSNLAFAGGSQTFLSNVANVANLNAGIDLSGHDAVVSGGLLVNNGYVIDSSNGGAGTHKVIANFGSLVKGSGFYQNTVLTPGGYGIFQPGNGPGSATFGSFHFSGPTGNTGVSDFQWQINDAGPSATYPAATGMAGPTPNAAGQVSGWGLVKVGVTPYSQGNFSFDGTPTDKLIVNLQSLAAPNDVNGNPNASGTYSHYSTGADTSGPLSEFDRTKAYTWPVVTFQGTFTGPTDAAALNASTVFDTGQFAGVQPGTFGWALTPNTGAGGHLDLVYTPPPATNNPPPAPNTPTAVANGPNSVTISWNAVSDALNYKLEYATGAGGPWTQVYNANGTTFTDDNSQFGHLFANTTYYYRVLASNAAGESPYSGIAAVTTAHNPTTTVASVVVNDGGAQRSEVRSIAVTFSGVGVTFAGGDANAAAAFQLTNVADNTNVILSAAVSTDSQGRRVVTLRFSGDETDRVSAENGGTPSLTDGRYSLTIFSSAVTGIFGQLDGDGNGTPGGDYVSPADTLGGGPGQLHLYRIFGDTNGDGVVDQQDLGQFRATFNTDNTSPLYISFLDADNSGSIDQQDLGQFRSRFNANVF